MRLVSLPHSEPPPDEEKPQSKYRLRLKVVNTPIRNNQGLDFCKLRQAVSFFTLFRLVKFLMLS